MTERITNLFNAARRGVLTVTEVMERATPEEWAVLAPLVGRYLEDGK